MAHPDDLPADTAQKARNLLDLEGIDGKARTIADHIAGMTDRYAIAQGRRLGLPGSTASAQDPAQVR